LQIYFLNVQPKRTDTFIRFRT